MVYNLSNTFLTKVLIHNRGSGVLLPFSPHLVVDVGKGRLYSEAQKRFF